MKTEEAPIHYSLFDYWALVTQGNKWTSKSLAEGAWGAPVPIGMLAQANLQRLLIIGGGGGRELKRMSGILPADAKIVVTDINHESLRIISENVIRIVADANFLPFQISPDKNEKLFDTILMVGVATSLVGHWLDWALAQGFGMLSANGKIILSEFIRDDESERSQRRQANDRKAINKFAFDDFELGVSGIKIIAPFGLSKEIHDLKGFPFLISLLVTLALFSGKFQRLTQHRTIAEYKEKVIKFGFEVLQSKQTQISNPDNLDETWPTVQILAKKKDVILNTNYPQYSEGYTLGKMYSFLSLLNKLKIG